MDFKGKIRLNPGEAVPNSALSSQEKRYEMFRKEQNNAKNPMKVFRCLKSQIPLAVTIYSSEEQSQPTRYSHIFQFCL